MDITVRGLWTMLHGMGFGALYLLACSGALLEIYRYCAPQPPQISDRFLRWYLVAMALLAWATVLTGTYILYPWYRAAAPPGTAARAYARPQLTRCSSR